MVMRLASGALASAIPLLEKSKIHASRKDGTLLWCPQRGHRWSGTRNACQASRSLGEGAALS